MQVFVEMLDGDKHKYLDATVVICTRGFLEVSHGKSDLAVWEFENIDQVEITDGK